MLHAHRPHPAPFGGLFLQSGRFFTPRSTRRSAASAAYPRITRFVGEHSAQRARSRAGPGGADLRHGRGEPAQQPARWPRRCAARATGRRWSRCRDVHNYIAWRDAFDPHLTGLLAAVVVGCRRDATRASGRAGDRRRGHGHRLRALGPAGAGLPVRAGPGLGLREQRHGRRGRPADRRRPAASSTASTRYDGAYLVRPRRCRSRSGPAGTAATRTGSSTRSCRASAPTAAASAGDRHDRRSLGAFHARELRAASGPTCSRWRSACPATTTRRPGTAGASAATRPTSTTRCDYVPDLHGDHLDWLRGRLSACCWSCGQGSGRTPTGSLDSDPPRWPRCCARRASGTSSTCGATTSRTTGRPGDASSPTTCRGSAE